MEKHRFVYKVRIPRSVDDDGAVHRPFPRKGENFPGRKIGEHPGTIANSVVVKLPLSPIHLKGHVRTGFRFDVDDSLSSQKVAHLSNVLLDDIEIC